MVRNSAYLTRTLIALGLTIAALAITSAIVSRPTVGPTNDPSAIIAHSFRTESWLHFALLLVGVAAALSSFRRAAIVLAGLCAVAGLGLALAHWLPAELIFYRVTPQGPIIDVASYPPGDARIIFLGPWYLDALVHLLLGFVGSTFVLAVIQFRRARP